MDTGIGGILREARNRRRLDLSEVEDAIKIRMRYLLAMENEEWDVLPGGAYTRGFIRTYASYLGLDGDRIAEDFRNAVGDGGPPTRAEPAVPPRRPSARAWVPGRAVAVFLIGGLVAAMVVIGSLSGGGGGPSPPRGRGTTPGRHGAAGPVPAPVPSKVVVRLTATAEVWVCLLDAHGTRLVNGQILEEGAQAGPFRSSRFLLSLGNGQIALMVGNRAISVPETGSPIGYRIDSGGRLNTLTEAERPTCT